MNNLKNFPIKPLVAICLPAYEKLNLFERAINSIKAQTYDNYIIIITDNSATNVIEEYVKKHDDEKTIYHHNAQNLGASGNTNQSIRYAIKYNADIIKILYQDDWFTFEDSLEKMVEKLIKTNADIIFTGDMEAFPNLKKKRICSESQIKAVKEDFTLIYRSNILGAPSNILFKTSELFFDSAYTWLLDVDFYLRILKDKKMEYIYEPLMTIGHDGEQLTDYFMLHPQIMLKETILMYKKYKFIHTCENRKYIIKFAWLCSKILIKKGLLKRNEK